jgi:WD40 repeat protein
MNADSLAARIGLRLGSAPIPSEDLPPEGAPPAIPDHEILGRIGAGSYGEVWLARSVTGTLNAVKVIRCSAFSNDRPYEREFRGIVQFEPVSRLHPHVVCILHVGRDDAAGHFFYVMELADNAAANAMVAAPSSAPATTPGNTSAGDQHRKSEKYVPRTLASDLKARGHLPVADVLRLGVQLADALGHLHRHGLVHRDVKPSNVIFVRGRPKLADIGLVAGKDETRSFVGTAGFVPPEGHGTERADLFSLGRLLYESVSGKDRCEFPELPPDLDRWPDAEREALLELSEVLERTCDHDPAKRHANAAELAADLNLILSGQSVRHAYGIERRLRRARRVSLFTLGVLALTAGILAFQDHARRAAEVRASGEALLRQRAEAAERAAQRQLYTALLEQARAKRLSGEMGHRVATLAAVKSAAAISNTAELRREAFGAFALPDLRMIHQVTFEPTELSRALDPSLERFAVSRGRDAVEVRATSDRRLLASLPASTNLEAHLLIWSPDGRFLAFKRDHDAAGVHADLEVWDVTSNRRAMVAHDAVTANALSFHPFLPQAVAGGADGLVRVWDVESGRELHRVQLPTRAVAVRFSQDGQMLAAVRHGDKGSVMVIHDVAHNQTLATHPLSNWLVKAEWHPDGRSLATTDYAGKVRIVDARTGTDRTLGYHKASAVDAAFSPGGDFLITGGWEREVICWDLRGMERAFTVGVSATHAQFRPDGKQCAIYTPDGVMILEVERPSSLWQFHEDLGRWLNYGSFSPDGRWLAASGDEFTGVWDLQNPGPAAMIPGYRDRVPLFAPEGHEFYTYWGEGLRRWRIDPTVKESPPSVTELPVFKPNRMQGLSIASNQLVLTSADGIRFMPLGNADPAKVRFLPKAGGWSSISPDNRLLAMRLTTSPLVRVYSLPEVERVAWLTNRAGVWTSAFSPRGDELVIATTAGLEFYNVTNWQRTRELAIPCERQATILFAPDGETFWLTSDARTSALRSTRTLEVLLPLPLGHLPIALSPDGRQLAVSIDMRRVQVWNLDVVSENLRKLGLSWSPGLQN